MTIENDVGTDPTVWEQPSKTQQVASRSADEATNVASTAVDGARDITSEVATQAKQVAGEAKEQLDELVERARDEAHQQAELRSQQAASQLRTLSRNLQALAEGRPADAGALAGYLRQAEQGAQGVLGFSGKFHGACGKPGARGFKPGLSTLRAGLRLFGVPGDGLLSASP